ncbi:MAG: TrmH family RNA methyltransferase [Bacteroidia bacterium]
MQDFHSTAHYREQLTNYLLQFVAETRRQRFNEVLSQRMKHMCVVLENIYQAHNASAVLRSCDCFGIQNVHFIENKHKYRISDDVAMGSSNWLSITRHSKKENNTVECLNELKRQGYRIVATTPHKSDCNLSDLPVREKFALVFGTEIDGITPEVFQHADEFVKIPMYGFTESFNISVSAALCMYELSEKIRKTIPDYHLDEEEKKEIFLDWVKNSVKRSDLIIKEYDNNLYRPL